MMRLAGNLCCVALLVGVTRALLAAPGDAEAWVEVPMPSGFHVESTELDGPVFADANGRTLYTWPSHKLRNGYSGETQGNPACYDEVLTVTAGLMSPYPPGILLPDVDQRPSCTDLWPPVLAAADARPIGDWTIVGRKDGTSQWMYDEQPLYTSVLDKEPGDVIGGTTRRYGGDSPAMRVPAAPPWSSTRIPGARPIICGRGLPGGVMR